MGTPKYPSRAQSWPVRSGDGMEERIMAGAIQLLIEDHHREAPDPKLPYRAYIVGLKRLTLKQWFANPEEGLKAAKIQALALIQQGK